MARSEPKTDTPAPGKDVAVQNHAPALSQAEKQRARMDALIKAVNERSGQLSILLADSGIPFAKFVEVFRRALIKNTDLLAADAGSVIEACINACTDGLLPDGRQGAMVIYKMDGVKRANWQPMYQGLMEIAYRSGNFKSIEARVVYAGDFFEYEMGDEPKITHKPAPRAAGTTRAIVASYAVAKTVNGGVFREVFEGEDIRKVNAVSKATKGPGKDWPEEMAKKGPVRRMWKYLPKDDRMNRIAERDNESFDLDALVSDETDAEAGPALKAGFAKPQAPAPAQVAHDSTAFMGWVRMDEDDGREYADVGKSAAAEEEPKAREAEPPPAEDEDPEGPAALFPEMDAAKTWAALKQVVRNHAKTPAWASDMFRGALMAAVWERALILGLEGVSTPDMLSDLVLFEAWLRGAGASADEVDSNYRVVQQLPDFKRLTDDEKAHLGAVVEEVKEL